MFERQYALRSFEFAEGEATDAAINAAVADYDRPDAAASVACMSTTAGCLFILIEYWRNGGETTHGDHQQGTSGTVDRPPEVRKPRRRRASREDDTGAAAGDQPARVDDRLGQRGARVAGDEAATASGRSVRVNTEEDVPLPFDRAYCDTTLPMVDRPGIHPEPEIEWP